MYQLDDESAAELAALGDDASVDALRAAIDRICADPSGRRNPQHHFTKKFHKARKYVKIPAEMSAWELTHSKWRGVFVIVETEKGGETHRLIAFVPIRGKRFLTVQDAPWH